MTDDEAPLTLRRPSIVERKPAEEMKLAQAYERCRHKALGIHASNRKPCRAPAVVAAGNYRKGVNSLLRFEEQLRTEVPGISFDLIHEGVDFADALEFAEQQVFSAPGKSELQTKLERIRELREPMLGTAEILAKLGVIPPSRTEAIRSGSGNIDTAQDGVDLHNLFVQYGDVLRGKHPFPESEIEEIGALGAWLVEHLPAHGEVEDDDPEAIRDALWTLLMERSILVRKLGYYLWGDDFINRTPPLLAG